MAEKKNLEFKKNSESWLIVFDWWKGLVGDGDKDSGGRDRAGCAELRRCKDVQEVVFVPAYQLLRVRLLEKGYVINEESLAAIAGLLAHIKPSQETDSIAKQMARTDQANARPAISKARFRRLLRIRDRNELYQPLARVIHHLDQRISPSSLAGDVYFWGEATRRRWANDYYLAALRGRDTSEIEQGEQK